MPRNIPRLLSKILISDGCWEWTGAITRSGYGHYGSYKKGLTPLAHRQVYEVLVGPIPEGMTLDHLCRNRACVNPAHLEPCTMRENIMRSPVAPASVHAHKTECVNGHPFTEENTRMRKTTTGFARECRICRRAAKNRAYARKQGREIRACRRTDEVSVG